MRAGRIIEVRSATKRRSKRTVHGFLTEGLRVLPCNNVASPNMLCGHCGATTSPEIDRCRVCHTPIPAPVEPGRDPATTEAGFDRELTRLSTGTASSAQIISGSGGIPVLQPGQQFASRYTIIRLLGSGGMAAVYQAWDETLGTAVALKLIRVDAGTPALELRQLEDRFKRELKLARQVTHPNVVRIHDLGEVESTLYLTMEYVQGADLATLLQREPSCRCRACSRSRGRSPPGSPPRIAPGIVHRDLKPANIMVDAQDHALLMDFGIARSTSAATDPHDARLADWHARLHGAGTGARRAGRRADRCLRLRPDPLRAARRRAAALQHRRRALESHRAAREGAAGAQDGAARRPAGARADRHQVPVSRARRRATRAANELLADLEALDEQGRARVAPRTRPAWTASPPSSLLGSRLIAATVVAGVTARRRRHRPRRALRCPS